ncbi:MAG: HNH endonuclease [Proteobacteria bacterium]|nr:MAG: HNH endonuclease [Pseudomonadota bacterium]
MIDNAVAYEGDVQELVDNYNAQNRPDKKHTYWQSRDVDATKSVIKKHYIQVQGRRCCYCNIQIGTAHGRVWDVEHIIAKSTHPHFLFEPRNLAVSCIECNENKSDKAVLQVNNPPYPVAFPDKSEDYIIVHPHFDEYEKHISIYLEKVYAGDSPKGCKTIEICGLTRINLMEAGWDPKLSDSGYVMDKANELLAAKDADEMRHTLTELLMLAQVGLSRTLLS